MFVGTPDLPAVMTIEAVRERAEGRDPRPCNCDWSGACNSCEYAVAARGEIGADLRLALSRLAAAERERDRYKRQIETTPPWNHGAPLTDEEMRALRTRWSIGPEEYQADADALIATVVHQREEIERLREAARAVKCTDGCQADPPYEACSVCQLHAALDAEEPAR